MWTKKQLDQIGQSYSAQGVTLTLHPRMTLYVDAVVAWLRSNTDGDDKTRTGAAFVIIEALVMDVQFADKDSAPALRVYLDGRDRLDLAQRYERFQKTLTHDDLTLLEDAYDATRDNRYKEPDADPEKKDSAPSKSESAT